MLLWGGRVGAQNNTIGRVGGPEEARLLRKYVIPRAGAVYWCRAALLVALALASIVDVVSSSTGPATASRGERGAGSPCFLGIPHQSCIQLRGGARPPAAVTSKASSRGPKSGRKAAPASSSPQVAVPKVGGGRSMDPGKPLPQRKRKAKTSTPGDESCGAAVHSAASEAAEKIHEPDATNHVDPAGQGDGASGGKEMEDSEGEWFPGRTVKVASPASPGSRLNAAASTSCIHCEFRSRLRGALLYDCDACCRRASTSTSTTRQTCSFTRGGRRSRRRLSSRSCA